MGEERRRVMSKTWEGGGTNFENLTNETLG